MNEDVWNALAPVEPEEGNTIYPFSLAKIIYITAELTDILKTRILEIEKELAQYNIGSSVHEEEESYDIEWWERDGSLNSIEFYLPGYENNGVVLLSKYAGGNPPVETYFDSMRDFDEHWKNYFN